MASGGYRPGSGRPKGIKELRPRRPKRKKIIGDQRTPDQGPTENLMPLEYMLRVMRDPNADPLLRDRMAIAAAPYIHPKAGESKGKKDEKANRAKAAGSGKFAAGRPPLKVVK